MKNQNLQTILDFAIEKELEAVEFYTELKEKYNFNAGIIDEIIEMEKGHATLLQGFKTSSKKFTLEKPVPNLKLTDYIVSSTMHKNMSFVELLVIAAKKEEASKQLYLNLAQHYRGTEAEIVFKNLANEEAKHKLTFEKMYDNAMD